MEIPLKMGERIRLGEICHARSGDKGDIGNVGLIVYNPAHYAWVKEQVTAEAVGVFLRDLAQGPIERYELPKIGALNFVLHNALGGGVTRSLRIDGHGKGLSAILLEMEIEAPPEFNLPNAESVPTVKPEKRNSTIRLGGASAYENDHLEAAVDLAQRGQVDYLIFDCLSEKTISECALRMRQGGAGYDLFLEEKLRAVLPHCVKDRTKIIANGGAADVEGAAQLAHRVCQELNLPGFKVAYVLGADVLDLVKKLDPVVSETGKRVSAFGDKLVSAHAYQGARPIVEALRRGADLVLTGRAGDSTQYLAPMIHAFEWPLDSWNLMGRALGIGHLMECAGQLTGGYYADPGRKDVPGLHSIGFPVAEVQPDGDAVITKLSETGGVVSVRICKEQLLYEIGDPGYYVHNDGVVDFTTTEFHQVGPDRVVVTGTTGHPPPATVKIVLGVLEGFVGMGRAIYGGTGAYNKARLAAEVVCKRLTSLHGVDPSLLRVDFIGANALFSWDIDPTYLKEVELRVSGHFETREKAWKLVHEVAALPCNGPTGVNWGRPIDSGGVEAIMGLYTGLLPKEAVEFEVQELVA